MKNKDWYVINNLEVFINTTRAIVFNSFGKEKTGSWDEIGLHNIVKEEQDEFDKILSYDESILIAQEILRQQTNKHTLDTRYLVNDKTYNKFLSALNERMIGNLLNNLVNKGLVETAFDTESNDFIFWAVDKDDNKKPKTNRD